MSELRIETLDMPGADVGPLNPLPRLPGTRTRDLHALALTPEPGVPADIVRNMTYGRVASPLPYAVQDGYTRQKSHRNFRVAVLENDRLRATVMLEHGGRLRSLYSKEFERELLFANPVFQPANLAIRNAWFCGGVEWNIGLIGHSPFTCSPLFAAEVDSGAGFPVLRLWEFERIRSVPFQIDMFLPDESPALFVRVRIRNPHTQPVPMYWWSNIAVTESEDTRVLVPADSAYHFDYGKRTLELSTIPLRNEVDVSHPTNLPQSTDFFFHIPEGVHPWICALDKTGCGLMQTSTSRLRGRKLFAWGMGAGGRTWQRFLAQPGCAYIEVQAGLARTQAEHLPMPAGCEWEWLEAYSAMAADPVAVQGMNWTRATAEAARCIEERVPRGTLEDTFTASHAWKDMPPVKLFQLGAGWGALERLRRKQDRERPFSTSAIRFPDVSLGSEQAPWLELLRTGRFPCPEQITSIPPAFMLREPWFERLCAATDKNADSGNWFAWLHRGIMEAARDDAESARTSWKRSHSLEPNPWALRNLAHLAQTEGKISAAADLLTEAHALHSALLPLAVEFARAMLEARRAKDLLHWIADMPATIQNAGRIQLLRIRALIGLERLDEAEEHLLQGIELVDVREGETSLSDLWFTVQEKRVHRREGVPRDAALRARVRREFPPPRHLDFRQST